ncbi:MAG: nucleotidyltransferase family protein [Lachnospiraceae bacterium]|nr:nucleotidyltransferase family protein [Lachnospiraceae bacterium]
MKEAIILCGGLGSRLRSVIGEKQKTMTLIDDTPFLVRVINYLKSYRVTRVIFATGYKSEEIKDYFGEKYYFGVEINYSEEKTQLGTGGAIRNALSKVKYDNVLVLNGDTLFEADLYKLKNNFTKLNADISIICKEVSDKSRYGTVKISFNEKHNQVKGEGLIVSFDEKIDESEISDKENLYINGGIYLMKKSLIETIPENEKVSLEKDLIPLWIKEQKIIGGVVSVEKFIDIGTPESLSQYKEEQNIKNEI